MNASKRLIERAGGVRGLANLLAVPVTTVQYWWEKGRIPAHRQDDVLATLTSNGIDASPADFFDLPKDTKRKRKQT